MGLKKTRVLISILLTIVIAASTVAMTLSFVTSITVATKSFVVKHVVTDEIAEECNRQLSIKYEALAAKSGIPARVFEIITSDFNTKEMIGMAIDSLYSDGDDKLYNNERIDYFERMCIEYLEGNDIKYKSANVKTVADEAARIYSDTVGIHNAESIKYFFDDFNQKCARIGTTALIVSLICSVLIVSLFKKRNDGLAYVVYGLTSGGTAVMLSAIIAIIAGVTKAITLSPAVYQDCFAQMLVLYFSILAFAGLAIIAIGAFLIFLLCKRIDRGLVRSSSIH